MTRSLSRASARIFLLAGAADHVASCRRAFQSIWSEDLHDFHSRLFALSQMLFPSAPKNVLQTSSALPTCIQSHALQPHCSSRSSLDEKHGKRTYNSNHEKSIVVFALMIQTHTFSCLLYQMKTLISKHYNE